MGKDIKPKSCSWLHKVTISSYIRHNSCPTINIHRYTGGLNSTVHALLDMNTWGIVTEINDCSCMHRIFILFYFIYFIWDSFQENVISFLYIKCYKIALRLKKKLAEKINSYRLQIYLCLKLPMKPSLCQPSISTTST